MICEFFYSVTIDALFKTVYWKHYEEKDKYNWLNRYPVMNWNHLCCDSNINYKDIKFQEAQQEGTSPKIKLKIFSWCLTTVYFRKIFRNSFNFYPILSHLFINISVPLNTFFFNSLYLHLTFCLHTSTLKVE